MKKEEKISVRAVSTAGCVKYCLKQLPLLIDLCHAFINCVYYALRSCVCKQFSPDNYID